jgi:hypothetical protein
VILAQGVRAPTVFLLSPAFTGGKRGGIVFREEAAFDLAVTLRREGAPLGDVYAFISGLYFRGKLAYARAFANPPDGLPGALVIAPGRGLVPPETVVTIDDLRRIAAIPVEAGDPRYREPLEQQARIVNERAGPECRFVLLGSLATVKYIEPLLEVFDDRLLVPVDFAGRGDMSRGGLMLRCASSGVELEYAPARYAARRGKRPPKLPKLW